MITGLLCRTDFWRAFQAATASTFSVARARHEVMENNVAQKADETRRRNCAIGVLPAGLYQAFDIKCDSHLTAKIQRS